MIDHIVAVDGPAGSGKSTIAKLLSKKYSFTYLDTGAMYRMMTLYTIENNLDINNKDDISKLLECAKLDIVDNKFILNGKDVSEAIRTPNVTRNVSAVSAIKEVREKLVDQQRMISKGKNIILDGRDIGTVVFPHADLKIFLVASAEERAKRRTAEYDQKGIKEDYEKVLKEIKNRDMIDSTRKESPLKKANDAIEIDSSHMTINEVVEKISSYIDKIMVKK